MSELETLRARLKKLEMHVRKTNRVGALILAVAGVGLLMGQAQPKASGARDEQPPSASLETEIKQAGEELKHWGVRLAEAQARYRSLTEELLTTSDRYQLAQERLTRLVIGRSVGFAPAVAVPGFAQPSALVPSVFGASPTTFGVPSAGVAAQAAPFNQNPTAQGLSSLFSAPGQVPSSPRGPGMPSGAEHLFPGASHSSIGQLGELLQLVRELHEVTNNIGAKLDNLSARQDRLERQMLDIEAHLRRVPGPLKSGGGVPVPLTPGS